MEQMGPTNLTMYCNGEQIHMHRYMLYLKVPFFRGIFDVNGGEVGCACAAAELERKTDLYRRLTLLRIIS